MIYSTLELIKESPAAHGAFDANVSESKRQVFCTVRSVTRSEYYLAASAGITPECVFCLSAPAEYDGEKLLEYDGVRYRVIRAYDDGNTVELTAQREAVE